MKRNLFMFVAIVTSSIHAHATLIYVGDRISSEDTLVDFGAADGAGNLTYIFSSPGDLHENVSGGQEQVTVNSVHFWGDGVASSLTPFFATYSGDASDAAIALASNYTIMSVGAAIPVDATRGDKDGVYSDTFILDAGEKLVTGFHTTIGTVAFNQGGEQDPTYIASGNTIGAIGTSPTVNAGFTPAIRSRVYAYNALVDIVAIPEPSAITLISLGGLAQILRGRR